jgi:hypothetical protein
MNFAWVFARPPDSALLNFYIMPVEGSMKGFEYVSDSSQRVYSDPPWPRDYRTVLQPLKNGCIKPGQDYILWFSFDKSTPEDLYIAVNLYPDSPANEHLVYYPIELTLGIDFTDNRL